MKKLILVLALISLTGCSTLMEYIPSRWDVNQAKVITDLQQDARRFNCDGNKLEQISKMQKDLEWFDIYAKTKPTRDVAKLTKPLNDTVNEFKQRAEKGPVSGIYCDLKKKIIIQQTDIIGSAVQGRF